MVPIKSVQKGSIAAQKGILSGDILLSINEKEIRDVLDYRFYIADTNVNLQIHRGAELFLIKIRKKQYDDIGLDFETFLMDKKQSCKNKCIFCFIDQLPKGMRDTLYFKDDDARLSFLMGNYITLTNLQEIDIQRILTMKISPIHISVHTTNPELRVRMMKNPHAGEALSTLQRFADGGISMECQIVLCKNWNDKAELTRSMQDLAQFYPHLESVSIVPAGFTCYRQNLPVMESFSAEECRQTIAQVEKFAEECYEKYGSHLFYCGDELYIQGGVPFPEEAYYEGYPQIENGVGQITSMQTEFMEEYAFLTQNTLPQNRKERTISIATGTAAYAFICALVAKLKETWYNLNGTVYEIKNDFFGKTITVAGLITGTDLQKQLQGKPLGEILYLPSVMLRHERDLFLDGMSLDDLSKKLGVPIRLVDNNGIDFIQAITGEEKPIGEK